MDILDALECELQRREFDSDGLVELLLECKAEIERLRAELFILKHQQTDAGESSSAAPRTISGTTHEWLKKGM